MKKTYIWIIILMALLGVISGVLMSKTAKSKSEKLANANFSVVTDDCIEEKDRYDISISDLTEANSSEIKTSPNAIITLKICYKKCNHTIVSKEKIMDSMVNLTQEEFLSKYSDWAIEEFLENSIILYKKVDSFCNEHYVLKNENGYIVIYELDENQKEILFRNTEISTQYLTENDLIEIEKGLMVYTKQELNKLLEDFEQ